MELYVPNLQLKEVSEVLTGEGVAFKVTDKTFTLSLAGKEAYEVTAVQAELLECDLPAVLDVDSPRMLTAYRLPSGKRILVTDTDGNFERLVEPPPGWER